MIEVRALGRAAARVLGTQRWLIGRDTRESGPGIEAALAAGFADEGADVTLLGVLPTPAVAYAGRVRAMRPRPMISASHNPYATTASSCSPPVAASSRTGCRREIERRFDEHDLEPLAATR